MRKLAVIALAFLLASCGDEAVGPNSFDPDARSGLISDAAHGAAEDRNPGFWWLAPMVPTPALSGTFQSGASPRLVVVCQYSSVGRACDPSAPLVDAAGQAAVYTTGAGLIVESNLFQVNFDTRAWALCTTTEGDTTTYRVVVYTDPLASFGGPFVLGSADFQLGANGGAARNLAVPDSMIALNDGRTLPIKFFLNEHAYPHELSVNTVPLEEDALCQQNCSVTFIPAGTDTVEASLHDEGGAELTSVQFPEVDTARVLIIDERSTDGDACAPGRGSTKKNCFRYEITGGPLPAPFRFGVCPAGITFGQGIWQLTQVSSDGTATAHGDEDVSDFLPCEGSDGSSSGAISLLRPILDRIVSPLYAEDTKRWGGTAADFSDFFWEVPAEMSSAEAASRDTTPGAQETFTVVVMATHGVQHGSTAEPLSGADVTFTITEGAGSLGTGTTPVTSLTVTTDANGEAAATLTIAEGANTLVVSSPDASGGPLSFSRTGISTAVPTTTTLSQAPMGATGSSTTLSAMVSPAPPAGSSVEFFENGSSIGTATTNSDGGATLVHVLGTALVPGQFTAVFTGVPPFQPSGSGTMMQHRYQVFQDLAGFSTAVGNASVATQDFEAIAAGTTVSAVIPGILNATSSFDLLRVTTCSGSGNCLFGSDGTTRAAGEGRYTLHLSAPRNALAFDIGSQDPNTGPATVQVFTGAGSVSVGESNAGSESTPNFFGIVTTLPIDSTTLLEGAEVSGSGNEEVTLDNIRVATTLGIFLEGATLSATTLTIGGPAVSYTVDIRNATGSAVSGVSLQGWTEQGTARRAAGGTLLTCGGGSGGLPNGTCVDGFTFLASNTAGGSGTLVPGAATAVIQLLHNGVEVDEVRLPVILQ